MELLVAVVVGVMTAELPAPENGARVRLVTHIGTGTDSVFAVCNAKIVKNQIKGKNDCKNKTNRA